jgi:hypothetical protein
MGLGDLVGLLVLPDQALPRQIVLVGETPAGQEVRLYPLHQILDAALLLRGAGVTKLGMKADLGGEVPESRRPPRLARGVAPECDGLHVVEGPGPRHAAPAFDDLEHRAQQRLQVHPGPPPDGADTGSARPWIASSRTRTAVDHGTEFQSRALEDWAYRCRYELSRLGANVTGEGALEYRP